MISEEKRQAIANEQSAEARFAAELEIDAKIRAGARLHGPSSAAWTGRGRPILDPPANGRLVGRVALAKEQNFLDAKSEYYIGYANAVVDGIDVFSWTSPIAATFYRENGDHELCQQVAVTRTFSHLSGKIADLVDERHRPDAPPNPFRRLGLSIPKIVRRVSKTLPNAAKLPQVRTEPAVPEGSSPEPAPTSQPGPAIPTKGSVNLPAKSAASGADEGVRVESLLRQKLEAPRTASLSPVLSTLQPDQYDLVTMPAMSSAVIEGQPGTGKTIVASHRAAYLVHPNTPDERTMKGKVLLVGPTEAYSKHVRGVVSKLATNSDRILVMSMREVLMTMARISAAVPSGPVSTSSQDVDPDLVRHGSSAVRLVRKQVSVVTLEQAYGTLLATQMQGEWGDYFRSLPSLKIARGTARLLPLLAAMSWEDAKVRELVGIEHIIVDEAQDVTAPEWLLLGAINEANQWTILGDLNQRRSNHTLSSWAQMLSLLKPAPELKVHRIERSYRSTKPILDYANRLLPRGARDVNAMRETGPNPTVEKVVEGQLPAKVITWVIELCDRYPEGTVAVIGPDPTLMNRGFSKAGWRGRSDIGTTWSDGHRSVSVLHHDDARGIEFDGVIVVEPGAFPRYFEKHGPLYTALTRANHELVVVHSRPLPEKLRRRRPQASSTVVATRIAKSLDLRGARFSTDVSERGRADLRFPTSAQIEYIQRLAGYQSDKIIQKLRAANYHHAVAFEIAKLEARQQN